MDARIKSAMSKFRHRDHGRRSGSVSIRGSGSGRERIRVRDTDSGNDRVSFRGSVRGRVRIQGQGLQSVAAISDRCALLAPMFMVTSGSFRERRVVDGIFGVKG